MPLQIVSTYLISSVVALGYSQKDHVSNKNDHKVTVSLLFVSSLFCLREAQCAREEKKRQRGQDVSISADQCV